PKRGYRRTDSQGLAVPIGDQAAMSRNRYMPHAACVALPLEKCLIKHLQIDDTPRDGAYHQCEQRQHDTETPWIQRTLQPHGATSLASAAAGTCFFCCSLARVSILL